MSNPIDPLFPPFGKQQAPNPYSQGLPNNVPPTPQPYGQQPVGPSPYAPPPPEAYQNPIAVPAQGQYMPQQYPAPGGYPNQNYYNPYNPYATTLAPSYNGLAVWSMILGISGIVFSFLFGLGFLASIAAVILGHMGLHKIKKNPGIYGGGGFAITGLILGYIMVALLVVLYGFILLLGVAMNGYSGY